jgi:hypothetical protein
MSALTWWSSGVFVGLCKASASVSERGMGGGSAVAIVRRTEVLRPANEKWQLYMEQLKEWVCSSVAIARSRSQRSHSLPPLEQRYRKGVLMRIALRPNRRT